MKTPNRHGRLLQRLAVACSLLLAAPGAARFAQTAPKTIVGDVIVPPGDYHLPMARIYALIKTKPGAEYNPTVVAEDVRTLYNTHGFANVQVKKSEPDASGKVTVYFLLTPVVSTVQEIIYEGARHLSNDDLVAATQLRRGQPLNPAANLSACRAIEKRYEEKARMLQVELLEGNRPTDTRVHFHITEGPTVKVHTTSFTGNHFVSGGRLRTQINTSRAFLQLLGGDYNPGLADNDVLLLEKYYKGNGFQDVIVSRELQWTADHRFVDIVFHITEGRRYRVASIAAVGSKTCDQETILNLIPVKSGDFFNQAIVEAGETNIKDYIGYRGHQAQVHEELTYSPNGVLNEVGILYKIEDR